MICDIMAHKNRHPAEARCLPTIVYHYENVFSKDAIQLRLIKSPQQREASERR